MNPLLNQNPDDIRQIDIVKIYGNKKCLVIDDFPEIRGSLSRILTSFGCPAVETAADGETAIKLCSTNTYDIVLCDYNLGNGKDGQQVLEEVRFLRVLLMTSLFVMITGESARHMVLGALECQPDDYITKPYTQASLKTRLNKAIIRHEALLHIKSCISKGDYKQALAHCNDMIRAGHRYAADCLKMKAQLHVLLKQLQEANQVYRGVLTKRSVVWAKLGMAKTQLGLGQLDAAEIMLQDIIAEDERYVEAHDMLAEVHSARSDFVAAQRSTENATRVSPKSALRHRKLAKLAEQNHDDDVTLKSHQQSIKWGLNSCHESEQDYFNYARKVADIIQGNSTDDARAMIKQANTFLDRARKRYADRPEVRAQAHMVETQLLISQGNESLAQKAAACARSMFEALTAPTIDTRLEYARTLHKLNEDTNARDLLIALAAQHADDANIMHIIDGITGEPISDTGKTVASTLTKRGIGAYEKKQFDAAIDVFSQALASYPNHIGLNLNLIQAIVAAVENSDSNPQHEALVKRSLRAVGRLSQGHKQYQRLEFLTKQLKKNYPEALIFE